VFWPVGPCDRGPLVIDIRVEPKSLAQGEIGGGMREIRGWSLLSGFGRPREKKGIEMAWLKATWCYLIHDEEYWPIRGTVRCKVCQRVRRVSV
jgi:hypothetical protein